MTFALLAAGFVVGVLIQLAAILFWQSRHGLLAQRLRRRIVVTTKTGDSFVGLLFEADRQILVLRDASVIDNGNHVAADGEVIVLRADVAYVQVP